MLYCYLGQTLSLSPKYFLVDGRKKCVGVLLLSGVPCCSWPFPKSFEAPFHFLSVCHRERSVWQTRCHATKDDSGIFRTSILKHSRNVDGEVTRLISSCSQKWTFFWKLRVLLNSAERPVLTPRQAAADLLIIRLAVFQCPCVESW